MNVLGISGGIRIGNQDGAAALLVDGQLVAAAEEERFTGVKFANGNLPRNAAQFCLRQAGLEIRDLDAVVFAGATYVGFDAILPRFFQFNFGYAPPVFLVDHHEAHAASTYYASGWNHALIVTMDLSGDRRCTTVSLGSDGDIQCLQSMHKPNSLGIFYSAVTQYLGFQRDSDEYKVMGMAAYGSPRLDFNQILEPTESGYRFHHEFIRGIEPNAPGGSKQERLFDEFPLDIPARVPGGPIDRIHYDIAASAQQQLELVATHLIGRAIRDNGVSRVCLAGGVALNCLMNQKIRELDGVQAVYAPPVCSDAGLALGAAYLHCRQSGEAPQPLPHAYWGPEFSNGEIQEVLQLCGARYRSVDDPAEAAARLVARGQIVGWFQGRMEYGPRALGSRSILADPGNAAMKDQINSRVKFREEFRPLSPSVIHARAADYFAGYADSPYMTQTFTAKRSAVTEAPAVVHADGTSRLQSVDPSTNPLYAKLIEQIESETGLPMVINTSLNAYNDPMVCSPHQALRTFFATGMDVLVIGDFVLEKKAAR